MTPPPTFTTTKLFVVFVKKQWHRPPKPEHVFLYEHFTSWKCFQIHSPHESSIEMRWYLIYAKLKPILVQLLQAQPTVFVKHTPWVWMFVWNIFSPLVAQVCCCPHTSQMRFLSMNVPWRNSPAHAHNPNPKISKVALQNFPPCSAAFTPSSSSLKAEWRRVFLWSFRE